MTDDRSSDTLVVLTVTADDGYREELIRAFGDDERFDLRTAGSVDAALAAFSDAAVDCLVSDYALPDSNGVRLLQAIRVQNPHVPFVLFSDHGSEEIASDAISADVTEYLVKDRFRDQWDRLGSLIEDAVAYHRRRADFVDTDTHVGGILNAIPAATGIVAEEDRLREAHPGAEISLVLECPEDLEVTATPVISSAIAELVENGVVHTDRPDPEVVVRITEADGSVRIAVEDEGDRIPPMERSIRESLEESDALSHGTGLGLWFVYWIVRRSNATLSFAEREPEGNVVTIEFGNA